MEHNHNHGHGHKIEIKELNSAFLIGIGLNLAYVIFQIIIGLKINSLSLLSDAGHNFLDVAGLALALVGLKLSKSKPTEKYTFGYKKASILISLLNAVILLISIFAIGYEAIFRFKNPEPIPGKTIAIIALIGIVINGLSAFMFFKNKEHDINIKAAFLHLAADAVVSLGLVIGGILIYFTHLYWIDPVLSLIICGVIIVSTWNLLRDSIRLSMDGVPENIDLQKVKTEIANLHGVESFHHIHVWATSTTQNALTAHVKVSNNLNTSDINKLKDQIKHELLHLGIQHSTIEFEFESCDEVAC